MASILFDHLRQSFAGLSSAAKILLVFLVLLFFLFLSSFLTILIAIPLYNLSFDSILNIITNPDSNSINLVKFFQISQSILLFIIPAFFVAFLFSNNTAGYLKLSIKPSFIILLLVAASLFFSVPFLNATTYLNSKLILPEWLHGVEKKMISLENKADQLTQLFLAGKSLSALAINMLMIAILPAFGEELLFRGVFQRLFIEWTRNKHVGIIMAAFLFSFFHFQFYGFLPRFLLGLYFGYLFVWSGSLWVPMTAHFVNNGMAVVIYFFSTRPMGDTLMDKIGTKNNNILSLVTSVVLTTICIMLIYGNEKYRKNSGQS